MGLPGSEMLPVMCRGCHTLVDFDDAEHIGETFFCRECASKRSFYNPYPSCPSVSWFHILWGITCLVIGVGGFVWCNDQMNQAAANMQDSYMWAKIILSAVTILGFVELVIGFSWRSIKEQH